MADITFAISKEGLKIALGKLFHEVISLVNIEKNLNSGTPSIDFKIECETESGDFNQIDFDIVRQIITIAEFDIKFKKLKIIFQLAIPLPSIPPILNSRNSIRKRVIIDLSGLRSEISGEISLDINKYTFSTDANIGEILSHQFRDTRNNIMRDMGLNDNSASLDGFELRISPYLNIVPIDNADMAGDTFNRIVNLFLNVPIIHDLKNNPLFGQIKDHIERSIRTVLDIPGDFENWILQKLSDFELIKDTKNFLEEKLSFLYLAKITDPYVVTHTPLGELEFDIRFKNTPEVKIAAEEIVLTASLKD